MSAGNSLGILDWGIGGLSVYAALRSRGGTADVVYFSDSGNLPYGRHDAGALRRRIFAVADFFRTQGVSRALVACNSASSVLHEDVEVIAGVRFESIIPAGVRAVMDCERSRIGVVGSELTIGSKIYERRLRDVPKRFAFVSAQALSAFVERGELRGDPVRREIGATLLSLGKIEALLLACTHYPALASEFESAAPEIELLDPAAVMIENLEMKGVGSFRYFTTGSAELSRRAARDGFGVDVGEIYGLTLALDPK